MGKQWNNGWVTKYRPEHDGKLLQVQLSFPPVSFVTDSSERMRRVLSMTSTAPNSISLTLTTRPTFCLTINTASGLTSGRSTSCSVDRCTSVHVFYGPRVSTVTNTSMPICIGQGIVERIIEQIVDMPAPWTDEEIVKMSFWTSATAVEPFRRLQRQISRDLRHSSSSL